MRHCCSGRRPHGLESFMVVLLSIYVWIVESLLQSMRSVLFVGVQVLFYARATFCTPWKMDRSSWVQLTSATFRVDMTPWDIIGEAGAHPSCPESPENLNVMDNCLANTLTTAADAISPLGNINSHKMHLPRKLNTRTMFCRFNFWYLSMLYKGHPHRANLSATAAHSQ